MNLLKITDITNQLGVSSRSLRYYEQVGLIQSVRSDFEKYRFYDPETVEKLKQILVLRKMQIPIKDILRIYESRDMRTVVEVFVARIHAIEAETNALQELKRIVSDFLHTMLQNGITKISAIPLLYEEMDKQLSEIEENGPARYETLSAVSGALAKPPEPAIVSLPAMRVLSSYLKRDPQTTDPEGFWRWMQARGITGGESELPERFEYQAGPGDVVIQRIPDDFQNDGDYRDFRFQGGLFASANAYLDEDLHETFRSLVACFDQNKYYQIDYTREGDLRHPAMLSDLISPDDQRELVSLLVPVKKRTADPALYGKPEEVTGISIAEIEAANPVLWETDVPPEKLLPLSPWSYRVNAQREGEYTPVIDRHTLSTGVAVRLPFRVEIRFRIDDSTAAYGYGSDEGNLCLQHGESSFCINKGNYSTQQEEAIAFTQPIFNDSYTFAKRGSITYNADHTLTWIVGETHLAVMIDREIRYCGTHFPYMSADLDQQPVRPIILTGNGTAKRFFQSVCVTQLATKHKTKIKNGELTMMTKRSNNLLAQIHKLITSDHGENYWFNGCGRYVMNALGEKDYDYDFFAGLTGDVFAQIFTRDRFRGDGVTDYLLSDGQSAFIEEIFARCGYASTFVQDKQLKANREMYLQTLLAYIDKGVPVISNLSLLGHPQWLVFVGYEEYGKTLLFMTDNITEPERISASDVFTESADPEGARSRGFIFVGEKREHQALKQIYRDAIIRLPQLLTTDTPQYCFGAAAFRAWADEIEGDRFDGMKPEAFDRWFMYTNYVCVLATNGSCCHEFLDRAETLNPDFTFISELHRLYTRMQRMWEKDPDGLEAIGGGFNITLDALQNPARRAKIVAKIREYAGCADEVVRVIQANIPEGGRA